jgi:hypothetical protein
MVVRGIFTNNATTKIIYKNIIVNSGLSKDNVCELPKTADFILLTIPLPDSNNFNSKLDTD